VISGKPRQIQGRAVAYQTRSPTRSEFTHIIISTTCNWDQLAYCSHSKAHNFA